MHANSYNKEMEITSIATISGKTDSIAFLQRQAGVGFLPISFGYARISTQTEELSILQVLNTYNFSRSRESSLVQMENGIMLGAFFGSKFLICVEPTTKAGNFESLIFDEPKIYELHYKVRFLTNGLRKNNIETIFATFEDNLIREFKIDILQSKIVFLQIFNLVMNPHRIVHCKKHDLILVQEPQKETSEKERIILIHASLNTYYTPIIFKEEEIACWASDQYRILFANNIRKVVRDYSLSKSETEAMEKHWHGTNSLNSLPLI